MGHADPRLIVRLRLGEDRVDAESCQSFEHMNSTRIGGLKLQEFVGEKEGAYDPLGHRGPTL